MLDFDIEGFIAKIGSENQKCFTYEFSPPLGFELDSMFEAIKECNLASLIDAFVCTDAPLAHLKQSGIFASMRLQETFLKPCITTFAMRDKNSLALQGELLGMNYFDLRLILALTGDPIHNKEQSHAKGVFEGSSLLLLRMIQALNSGYDMANNPLKTKGRTIYGFNVLNSYAKNKEALKRRMRAKIKAGAKAIFTQPLYDLQMGRELLDWCGEFNEEFSTHCTLVFGFFPITSYKVASFLHDKLPGVFVPELWLKRLSKAALRSNEEEKHVGFEMSCELFLDIAKLHPKIHLMSSNKPKLIADILQKS